MAVLGLCRGSPQRAQHTHPGGDVVAGRSRSSRRPARSEAQLPEIGMTCMTPTALAGETARWFQPDSW